MKPPLIAVLGLRVGTNAYLPNCIDRLKHFAKDSHDTRGGSEGPLIGNSTLAQHPVVVTLDGRDIVHMRGDASR